MGHDIVSDFLLPLGCSFKIDVGDILLQFLNLFPGHRKTQLVLCASQSHPEAAPGLDALLLGEQAQHILRCIAGGKW